MNEFFLLYLERWLGCFCLSYRVIFSLSDSEIPNGYKSQCLWKSQRVYFGFPSAFCFLIALFPCLPVNNYHYMRNSVQHSLKGRKLLLQCNFQKGSHGGLLKQKQWRINNTFISVNTNKTLAHLF